MRENKFNDNKQAYKINMQVDRLNMLKNQTIFHR